MDRNLKLPASCPAPVKKMRKTGGADGPVRGKGGQYGAPGPRRDANRASAWPKVSHRGRGRPRPRLFVQSTRATLTLGVDIEIEIGIAIGIEHLSTPSREEPCGTAKMDDPDPDLDESKLLPVAGPYTVTGRR